MKAIDGTYATALNDFLWDPLMPEGKRAQILRAKRNEKGVDQSAATDLVGNGDYTPSGDRENPDHEIGRAPSRERA